MCPIIKNSIEKKIVIRLNQANEREVKSWEVKKGR